MYQQAFCIHFKDVKGEGSHDCTHNRVNVFERGILQHGHFAVSLTTVPHCTDCSCAQCQWVQAASNLVTQVTMCNGTSWPLHEGDSYYVCMLWEFQYSMKPTNCWRYCWFHSCSFVLGPWHFFLNVSIIGFNMMSKFQVSKCIFMPTEHSLKDLQEKS